MNIEAIASVELPRNQIARSGVQVKKENETFTALCSRSPQNLELGHFTFLFCRERQRNVPTFCSLNQLVCGIVIAVAVVLLKFPIVKLKLPVPSYHVQQGTLEQVG